MKPCMGFLVVLLSFPAVVTSPRSERKTDPYIRHNGPDCWPRGEFVQLDALVEPLENIETVRVFFRSDKYPDFYFVEMNRVDGLYQAVMPIPSQETERIIYYIEAVDRSLMWRVPSRTLLPSPGPLNVHSRACWVYPRLWWVRSWRVRPSCRRDSWPPGSPGPPPPGPGRERRAPPVGLPVGLPAVA
jgi:hypothetical protein